MELLLFSGQSYIQKFVLLTFTQAKDIALKFMTKTLINFLQEG